MVNKLIKILVEDKLGNIRNVNILRSNLSNYEKISKLRKRFVYKKLKKQFFIKDKIKIVKGVAESGRKFVIYTFPMNKTEIIEDKIDRLMERMEQRYNKVKNNNRTFEAQRVGVVIVSKDSMFVKKLNKKTNRLKKFILMDEISTISHSRDDRTTKFMFLELRRKILKFIEGDSVSPSVFDEDVERFAIKYFRVFFAKN